MGYDPIKALGLHCPNGGKPYVCPQKDMYFRFVGCCATDPCVDALDGICRTEDLSPAAFDPTKYYDIPNQQCNPITTPGNSSWYTCTAGPTFLGCCASNACANGGICPTEDLTNAILSDDDDTAAIFLTGAPTFITTATTATTRTTAPSSTAGSSSANGSSTSSASPVSSTLTPNPSSSSPPLAASSSNDSPPIGATVGGALGGLVILGIVACIFYYRRRKRRRTQQLTAVPTSDHDDDAAHAPISSPPPPWSPFQDVSSHNSKSPKGAPLYSPYFPPPPKETQIPLSQNNNNHSNNINNNDNNNNSYNHDKRKSLSKSLISLIGLNRLSGSSGRRSLISGHGHDDDEMNVGGGGRGRGSDWGTGALASPPLPSVPELDSPPPGGLLIRGTERDVIYYEVEGSTPDRRGVGTGERNLTTGTGQGQ
ncbi:hypothetical protein F5Y17DRAFT_47198 [Xylariaceae sp. FL0594]|nr:hypothetical protein F5Y17DRAFT_47198 [Xylariaceae sp. FL0594]